MTKKDYVIAIAVIAIGVLLGTFVCGLLINKSSKNISSYGSRETRQLFTVLDNVATSTSGVRIDTGMYQQLVCAVDFDAAATMTIKFAGSIADSAPTFTSSQSSSNQFDYVQVVDLEDGTSYDGDSGVSVTGSADHRMFEINTNLLNWVTAVVTSWTSGTTTVACKPANNQ
jgi:hypothetical protein